MGKKGKKRKKAKRVAAENPNKEQAAPSPNPAVPGPSASKPSTEKSALREPAASPSENVASSFRVSREASSPPPKPPLIPPKRGQHPLAQSMRPPLSPPPVGTIAATTTHEFIEPAAYERDEILERMLSRLPADEHAEIVEFLEEVLERILRGGTSPAPDVCELSDNASTTHLDKFEKQGRWILTWKECIAEAQRMDRASFEQSAWTTFLEQGESKKASERKWEKKRSRRDMYYCALKEKEELKAKVKQEMPAKENLEGVRNTAALMVPRQPCRRRYPSSSFIPWASPIASGYNYFDGSKSNLPATHATLAGGGSQLQKGAGPDGKPLAKTNAENIAAHNAVMHRLYSESMALWHAPWTRVKMMSYIVPMKNVTPEQCKPMVLKMHAASRTRQNHLIPLLGRWWKIPKKRPVYRPDSDFEQFPRHRRAWIDAMMNQPGLRDEPDAATKAARKMIIKDEEHMAMQLASEEEKMELVKLMQEYRHPGQRHTAAWDGAFTLVNHRDNEDVESVYIRRLSEGWRDYQLRCQAPGFVNVDGDDDDRKSEADPSSKPADAGTEPEGSATYNEDDDPADDSNADSDSDIPPEAHFVIDAEQALAALRFNERLAHLQKAHKGRTQEWYFRIGWLYDEDIFRPVHIADFEKNLPLERFSPPRGVTVYLWTSARNHWEQAWKQRNAAVQLWVDWYNSIFGNEPKINIRERVTWLVQMGLPDLTRYDIESVVKNEVKKEADGSEWHPMGAGNSAADAPQKGGPSASMAAVATRMCVI